MLASSFTSYLGVFNAYYRDYLWKEFWMNDLKARDIPLSLPASGTNTAGTNNNNNNAASSSSMILPCDPLYNNILANESTLATWQNEGLPSDRISLENGAILTNSNRWPLLIDPQLQGIRWLIQHETIHCEKQGKSLVMLKNGEKTMMMKLIQAISNGDTVILENIDEHIDAALTPILSKSIHRKGKNYYLKLGDEDIEYSPNFQLFLQTKLSNPHYQPEILTLCNLINFLVTKKGLEDHLLAMIVSEEEPELEKTRNELILSFNNYKIQLKELEDLLLERLSNAPEDILSDIPLIEGLEHTKQTATEINEAVTKAIQTEIGINAAREIYRIIATEAALLYFIFCNYK